MTILMRLVPVLPGVLLLTGSWLAFVRLRPRNGVVHPWMSSRIREELTVLALVSSTGIGFGLILQGLVGAIR